jgi:hypothetical protein
MGEGNLCYFFAIAENAEFGFAGEHFLPGEYTYKTAAISDAIIFKDIGPIQICLGSLYKYHNGHIGQAKYLHSSQ